MKSLDKPPEIAISRRSALVGVGAGALGLGLLPGLGGGAIAASLPQTDGLTLPVTPQENLENLVRMTASLDAEDCPWFFNGSVYAVVGDQAPVELMRVQGLEMYNMQRLAPDSFMMRGLTTTFMTDVENGEWLRELKNPYTGRTVEVPAHAATTPPGGGHLYQTTGVRPVSSVEEIPDAALNLWWTAAGEFVWLQNETVYPPGVNQPRKQRQSNFVRKDHFADKSLRRLPCAFTVSFWAPWSSWLGMDGMPGHMVWHASGSKLESVKDLPPLFKQRVENEHPEMMSVKID